MPFIGELDDNRVIPEQVADQTTVICPSCEGEMRPRQASSDGRVRHFFHVNESGSCSGGESDEHRKMKSLAVSKLRQIFEGQYNECGPEVALDVGDTASTVDRRIADALIRFEDHHSVYGDGLIVEVQFRNKGKEIPATTKDYLDLGYSVYWAHPRDFTDTEFRFDQLESAFDADSNLAYTPLTSVNVDEFEESDLLWEDPIPDCDHVWKDMGDFEFCAGCRINRTYSTARTRFLYDNMGLLGPLDRDDVPKVSIPPVEEKEQEEDSEEVLQNENGYTGYESWQVPREIPEECPHYSGPEHHWVDYSWADQGKAMCRNCDVTVEKDRLPDSVVIEDSW